MSKEIKQNMKYLIIYSNGHRELRKAIDFNFIHLLEQKVVQYIFDFKELKEYSVEEKGWVKVLQVSME